MRVESADGHPSVVFYEGPRGKERKVRKLDWTYGTGNMRFYDERGEERKMREEKDSDGATWYYKGAEDAERLVCIVYPDGDVHYFEGAEGEERHVRARRGDGGGAADEGGRGAVESAEAAQPAEDKGDVRAEDAVVGVRLG